MSDLSERLRISADFDQMDEGLVYEAADALDAHDAEIKMLREAGQMALAAFDHLNKSQPLHRGTTEFHCLVPEGSQITCLSDARTVLQGSDE